jgi:hypothetical protein
MKTITLRKGDTLIVLKDHPFGADLCKGDTVKIVGFDYGNACTENSKVCPQIRKYRYGNIWHTDLKELFHNFKKESE